MVFTLRQRRWAALAWGLGLLVWPGCDEGPQQLARANARYADLIQRGVPPRDSAWDGVMAAFEAIPKDSKARPEAERRLEALRRLRGVLPPRPLATPGTQGQGADALEAQRAECERWAKALGAAPVSQREEAGRALRVCMERLVQMEASAHPRGEEDHAH